MRILFGSIGLMLICFMAPLSAAALSSEPTNGYVAPTDSPLVVTEYMATYDRLDYVQIFNSSNEVFNLDGWTAEYALASGEIVDLNIELSGLMRPKSYAALADTSTGLSTPFAYTINSANENNVASITLKPPATHNYLSETAINPSYTKTNQCSGVLPQATLYPSHFILKREVSSVTGDYLSGYCYENTESTDRILFIDELYNLPASPLLEIVEIMPNARKCSPFEAGIDCRSYVKLFNAGTTNIRLDDYRLRNGYNGQNATSTNTYYLSGDITSGEYRTYEVGITTSANWLWFEDVYGIRSYKNSVVAYPTSSAATTGQAWMYDDVDGQWKWTTKLSGVNTAPEYEEAVMQNENNETGLTPCRDDQFRNPLTNRCKLKTSATSSLIPCKAGQVRNPVTNRCRQETLATSSLVPCKPGQIRNPSTNRCKSSTGVAASSLVPCKPGQFRNPATNRCKSNTAASSSLKPCAPNQERNPLTNRCRNKVANISADFPVEKVAQTTEAAVGWWAFGGVGILAAGYAGWEWRREMFSTISKIATYFTSSK